MNVVELGRLPKWVADGVKDCKECRKYPDGTAVVCGWHENLTAGARAVQAVVEDEQ